MKLNDWSKLISFTKSSSFWKSSSVSPGKPTIKSDEIVISGRIALNFLIFCLNSKIVWFLSYLSEFYLNHVVLVNVNG